MEVVRPPRKEGGLGIRRLEVFNSALMIAHVWKLISLKESLWVKWVHEYKLKRHSFLEIPLRGDVSWGWRKILQLRRDLFLGAFIECISLAVNDISAGLMTYVKVEIQRISLTGFAAWLEIRSSNGRVSSDNDTADVNLSGLKPMINEKIDLKITSRVTLKEFFRSRYAPDGSCLSLSQTASFLEKTQTQNIRDWHQSNRIWLMHLYNFCVHLKRGGHHSSRAGLRSLHLRALEHGTVDSSGTPSMLPVPSFEPPVSSKMHQTLVAFLFELWGSPFEEAELTEKAGDSGLLLFAYLPWFDPNEGPSLS
ncbi:hypothetical protein Tco_0684405 [Tanacetum coccineum]